MTRQLPNFRPSRFTVIAVGSAFCLAAAGSVSAVTLSSYATHSDSAAAAAGLTSATSQARQRAAAETMAAVAQKEEAARIAAAQRAAHAAHQRHVQLVAAKAAEQRAAAARAAAAQAAQRKAAQQKTAQEQAAQQAAAQPSGSPQQIAQELLDQEGEGSQFSCLDSLWGRESGWSVSASNPGSGAYGIPQALPGSRMSSAGPDWQTNAATQIKWGLGYIKDTYGTPCDAWSHEESDGWY